MLQKLLESKRTTKRLITLVYDGLAIPLAIYMALALRHGDLLPALIMEL